MDSCSEVTTSCGGNKENEGHDMCIAATGCLFLAFKYKKEVFFGEANSEKKKKINLQVYSIFHFQVVKSTPSAHCAKTTLR
jgi:hypothetical protein